MRASTVFAIALSLLVGLGAAAAAKYAGLFNKKEAEAAPATAPVAIKALAPKSTIYRDITVTADQVMVIELGPEAQADLRKRFGDTWQSRLFPAFPNAAHMRVSKATIGAGQPLLKDDFEDPDLPAAISMQLDPGMRAVNVSVPKNKVVGGVLRKDELVDVFLTSNVSNGGREEVRTALVARGCKVVMKRNNLWTVMVADPDNQPLNFTLQANPYRAALIEYASTRGQFSLMPVPARSPAASASPEFDADAQRAEAIARGEMSIGDEDLRRIFNLRPPAPTVPRVPPLVIQHLNGVNDAGRTVINRESDGRISNGEYSPAVPPAPAGSGASTSSAPPPSAPAASGSEGYSFQLPSATGGDQRKRGGEAGAPIRGN